MIAEDNFPCGSNDNPVEASLVCVEQGCRGYAFTCGRKNCDCKAYHNGHSMVYIDVALKKIAEPVSPPANFGRMEKDIDNLIDAAIKELENIKADHHKHLKEHWLKELSSNVLKQKLARRQHLDITDATGGSFWQMLQNIDKAPAMSSPYSCDDGEIDRQLMAFRLETSALVQKIGSLWKCPLMVSRSLAVKVKSLPTDRFLFSSQYKHPSIEISGENTTATLAGKTHCSVVVVEPSLPMGNTSKISFRVNQLRFMYIGICYRDLAEKQSYRIDNSFENGLYLLGNGGYMLSHSEQGFKKTPVTFEAGGVVYVEFDPAIGKLTFSKKIWLFATKSDFIQTDILRTTTQPVNFCVRLDSWSEAAFNSVSIV